MTKTEKVILGLLEHARKEILNFYEIESSLESARVALNVFDKFQLKAFELPVQTIAANSVMRQFLIDYKRWPGTPELKELIEKGAYSVGVGFGKNKSDSIEHLVCIVEDQEKNCFYLIDLSIDQANRPKHGMPIKPLAWPIEENFQRRRYDGDRFVSKRRFNLFFILLFEAKKFKI